MMNCSEARELIQLYMDNELDARDTLAVQSHLDACRGCARQLDDFMKQDQMLRQVAKSETRDNGPLRETILTRIGQQAKPATPQPRKARNLWLQSLSGRRALLRVAAVLLVAILAGFFLWRGASPFGNDKVYAAAVQDHAHHCTLEQLERLSKSFSDLEQIDKLCADNGRFEKTPDLSEFGFANIRARYCGFNGIKVLHLIYQNDAQQPLSLFMRLHDTQMIADNLVMLKKAGYEVASFTKAGVDVVVVSSLDERQTANIVKRLSDSL